MTLVLEESEDISADLLSPILACVKKDNEVCCLRFFSPLFFLLKKFYLLIWKPNIFICIFFFQEVLPVARKLGERVLESCATKLKPYLVQAIKSSDISLDDYSKVLSSICQVASDDTEQNEVHASDEHMVISFNCFISVEWLLAQPFFFAYTALLVID